MRLIAPLFLLLAASWSWAENRADNGFLRKKDFRVKKP
jgi:hypothetical protein